MNNNELLERLSHLVSLMYKAIDEVLDGSLKPRELNKYLMVFRADYEVYNDLLKMEIKNKNANPQQLSQLRKELKTAKFVLGQLEAEFKIQTWKNR